MVRRVPQQKITIRVPKRTVEDIDLLIQLEAFSSRSEIVRTAVRQLIDTSADKFADRIKKRRRMEELKRQSEELSYYTKK